MSTISITSLEVSENVESATTSKPLYAPTDTATNHTSHTTENNVEKSNESPVKDFRILLTFFGSNMWWSESDFFHKSSSSIDIPRFFCF